MRPLEPAGSVAERLRIQAVYCERIGSPLYAGLLGRAAGDFEAGGPVAGVLGGHEDDPADSMLALRLIGAVNRLVLRGVEPALGELYAARKRDPEAEWAEFRAVVERNAAKLRELVELPVQTNEVGRCAALLPGLLAVAAATGLPLRLLEVGASAGLNLRWDSYRYRAGDFAWGPADSPVRLDFELTGELHPDPPAAGRGRRAPRLRRRAGRPRHPGGARDPARLRLAGPAGAARTAARGTRAGGDPARRGRPRERPGLDRAAARRAGRGARDGRLPLDRLPVPQRG